MIKQIAAAGTLALGLATLPALAQDPDLSGVSSSVEAAQTAGLGDAIAAADALTVFVPTNDALGAAPADAVSALQADPATLATVIQYYAIPQAVMAADAVALAEGAGGEAMVETLSGEQLTIMVQDGNVMIKGGTGATATVVTPDIKVGNVILHVIDGTVLPSADVLPQ